MKNATPKTVRITITVPAKVQAYLEGLLRIGLYGSTIAEVAAQLVCEGLRSDLKQRRVKLIEESAPKQNS